MAFSQEAIKESEIFRSQWNKSEPTLHILPHWNWEGREGEVTPVFVYTSYPKAELFVNGKSQGMREKGTAANAFVYDKFEGNQWQEDASGWGMDHYLLMWNDVRYEAGELRVVAYDASGNKAEEKTIRTAGKARHLVVEANRTTLKANGEDMALLTIRVADKEGNLVPTDNREVRFRVEGAGQFEATANGDPTSLRCFQEPVMDLFSGASTAIVRSGKQAGQLKFTVLAKGVKSQTIVLKVE